MMSDEADGWGASHLEPPNIAGLALRTWGGSKCAKISMPERFGKKSAGSKHVSVTIKSKNPKKSAPCKDMTWKNFTQQKYTLSYLGGVGWVTSM